MTEQRIPSGYDPIWGPQPDEWEPVDLYRYDDSEMDEWPEIDYAAPPYVLTDADDEDMLTTDVIDGIGR